MKSAGSQRSSKKMIKTRKKVVLRPKKRVRKPGEKVPCPICGRLCSPRRVKDHIVTCNTKCKTKSASKKGTKVECKLCHLLYPYDHPGRHKKKRCQVLLERKSVRDLVKRDQETFEGQYGYVPKYVYKPLSKIGMVGPGGKTYSGSSSVTKGPQEYDIKGNVYAVVAGVASQVRVNWRGIKFIRLCLVDETLDARIGTLFAACYIFGIDIELPDPHPGSIIRLHRVQRPSLTPGGNTTILHCGKGSAWALFNLNGGLSPYANSHSRYTLEPHDGQILSRLRNFAYGFFSSFYKYYGIALSTRSGTRSKAYHSVSYRQFREKRLRYFMQHYCILDLPEPEQLEEYRNSHDVAGIDAYYPKELPKVSGSGESEIPRTSVIHEEESPRSMQTNSESYLRTSPKENKLSPSEEPEKSRIEGEMANEDNELTCIDHLGGSD
jgi:hypothetical protein